MKATRAAVYAAIDSERAYQEMRIARDGTTGTTGNAEHAHEHESYILYMDDYMRELKHVTSHTWGPGAIPASMNVLRKVVALGVACMEAHGAPQRAGFEQPLPGTGLTNEGDQ